MTRRQPWRPRRLSDRANAWLTSAADALASGRCELSELPPGVLALYVYGFEHGRETMRAALEQAEADRRRAEGDAAAYFERWHQPAAERREHAARERIAEALEEADARGEVRTEADVLRIALEVAGPPPAPPLEEADAWTA